MRSRCLLPVALAAALVLSVGWATSAVAAPDQSGSAVITEQNGFPPFCNQPCFTAEKSFEVYLDGNPTAPVGAACAVGENTYVYKIEHKGGSAGSAVTPGLTKFELSVETDDVASAGHIAGFGINPSATTVSPSVDVVTWDFTSPVIASGQMSTQLFVCSRLTPGSVTDTMVSVDAQFSLDAPGQCIGPLFEPPEAGEPMPCTIGFWKNRSDGKKGLLKFFPGTDFDDVVDLAVALSAGLFANANDLLTDLNSKGNRTTEQKARQQFAAVLLDLAAGDLFPENNKCKLFDGNQIDTNACGSGLSVGDAVAAIFADFANGDYGDAQSCSDDINNGIGVIGATEGE